MHIPCHSPPPPPSLSLSLSLFVSVSCFADKQAKRMCYIYYICMCETLWRFAPLKYKPGANCLDGQLCCSFSISFSLQQALYEWHGMKLLYLVCVCYVSNSLGSPGQSQGSVRGSAIGLATREI